MVADSHLDLSNLPTFEKTSFFACLNTDTEKALKAFPNVYQRATAAMRFSQQMEGGDVETMEVAYLRAALMEFVGMEEVLPIDLLERGNSSAVIRIHDTKNALFILLKELRNLQLHLVNSSFTREDRNAVSYSSIREPHYMTFPIRIIPLDDILQLKALKNARRYDVADFEAAILWLNDAQSQWGIGDVLQTGIEDYARLILNTYT